jgi:hypothetical protein
MIFGLGHAAENRPDDRRVIAGSDAELGMPVDEAGRRAGDGDVGEKSQRQASAHRRAVDRRDHRLAAVDQVVDHVARFLPNAAAGGEIRNHLVQQVEIAAGREGLARAGEQDGAHLRVGIDNAPDLGQLAVHVAVDRIELVRPVHHDAEHPLVRPIDQQPRKACIIFIHRSFSRSSRIALLAALG